MKRQLPAGRVEFSPLYAGERVGWVATTPEKDSTRLDIVAATVAPDGAQAWYEKERNNMRAEQQGFCNVTAYSALLHSGMGEVGASYQYFCDATNAGTLLHGFCRAKEGLRKKEWCEDRTDLVRAIARAALQADCNHLYPSLYYWINGVTALNNNGANKVLEGTDVRELLLPDTRMMSVTQRQLERAEEHRRLYEDPRSTEREQAITEQAASLAIPKLYVREGDALLLDKVRIARVDAIIERLRLLMQLESEMVQ